MVEAKQNRPSQGKNGGNTRDKEADNSVKQGSDGKRKTTCSVNAHINAEEGIFIKSHELTAGNTHNSKVFESLLTDEEEEAYANSADKSQAHNLKAPIPDLKSLLAAYPALAQPVAVFIALLGLATFIKTLIEGFNWAYTWNGAWGVLLVISTCILCLSTAMIVIKRLIRNQPVISNFPAHYLSHKPTIRWEFEKPDNRTYTFQVLVKQQGGGTSKFNAAPGTTFYNLYNVKNLYGNLSISIRAFADGRRYSTSTPIGTEIYQNAAHRITDTNRLRVAVHADPGDDVFCSFPDNQWHGFDIDMVKLVASELESRLGLSKRLEIKFTYCPWPEIIGVANQHQVDFAIASISISDERRRQYGIQFSKPYLTSSLGIISRQAETKGQPVLSHDTVTLDNLTGKIVAVHHETTASIWMDAYLANNDDKHQIDLRTAYSNPELSEWLNDGIIDVVMYDYHRAFSMLEPGMQIKKFQPATETGMDNYGLAFARNNSVLREHVDQIILANKTKFRKMLKERIARRRQAA